MRRHAVVLSVIGVVGVVALIAAGCTTPGGGTPTTVPTGPRGEVEPNGDLASATLIATDLSGVSGTGVVASETDADTFAFNLGSWRGVEVVVSGRTDGVCDPAEPAPDVQLLDTDQRVIGYRTSGTDGCSRISPLSEAGAGAVPEGRQYVRVLSPVASQASGAGLRADRVAALAGGGVYSLSIRTLDPVDEAEPNDSLAQSTPFEVDPQRFSHQIDGQIDGFGESPPSAPDYYALDLPDLVVADMSVYSPEFDAGCNSTEVSNRMSLQLLDAAGSVLGSHTDDSGCPWMISPLYMPAGRYYLRVDGSVTGRRYRIELRVASDSNGTETEPNDIPATANPVTTSGWLGGSRLSQTATRTGQLTLGDIDEYRIDLPTASLLWAGFSECGPAGSNLALVDDAGIPVPTVASGASGASCPGGIQSADPVPAGSYTVRVTGGEGPYSVVVGYPEFDTVIDSATATQADLAFRIHRDLSLSDVGASVLFRNREPHQVAIGSLGAPCAGADYSLFARILPVSNLDFPVSDGAICHDSTVPSGVLAAGDYILDLATAPITTYPHWFDLVSARLIIGNGMVTTTTSTTTTTVATTSTIVSNSTTTTRPG